MEHLTEQQIEAYFRRRLPAAELLSLTDHLGDCDVCERRIEGTHNGDGAFFELRSQVFDETGESAAHLTMQEAAAYVDRDLSGEALQMAEDHLSHCHECVLAGRYSRSIDGAISFRNARRSATASTHS